jgi:chromosome segregation ATPase
MVPIKLPAKATEAKLEVVEQTPARSVLSIWDTRSIALLEGILALGNLDAAIRTKLAPVAKLRQEIGRIDTEIEGKKRTREELDQRADETRANLEAIKRDPAAGALRKRLSDRLEQFTKDGDKLGRELVELQTKRTEKKVALEDLMQNLDLAPPKPLSPKK